MLDHSHQDLLLSLGLFVPSFYREAAALPAELSDGELFEHFVTNGLPAGFSPSPLFDAETVLAAARAAGLPPPETEETALGYWLRLGLAANIVPTALFDAAYYGRAYPEVASAGYFGFQHFLKYGITEKRRPSMGVDPHWIAGRMPPSSWGLPALLQFVQENTSGESPTRDLRLIDWPSNDPAATIKASIAATACLNRLAETFTDAQAERLANLFLPEFYKMQAGLPAATSDISALQHFVETGLASGLSCSPLFDTDTYRTQAKARGLRDFAADEPPLVHWLREGAAAHIVPTPCFDSAYYLASNPDVAAAGGFGFLHFLDYGLFEERRANAWFDPDFVGSAPESRPGRPSLLAFLLRNARDGQPPCAVIAEVTQHAPAWARDVAAFGEAYPALKAHYADLCAGQSPSAINLLFALFVPAFYIRSAQLPDDTLPLAAFAHFLQTGQHADIDPSPLFDTIFYRKLVAARPDCPAIGAEAPIVHYLREGIVRRIVPTLRFDAAFYMAVHGYLDPAEVFSFEHYLCHGLHEGLQPNAWFDQSYCAARITGGVGLPGYFRLLMYGLDEGVVPNPTLAGILGCDIAPDDISLSQFDALLAACHAWTGTIGHAGIDTALALFIPEAYDGGGALASDAGMLDRLIHFIAVGLARGDRIGPLFDAAFYLAAAQKAGLPGIDALSSLRHAFYLAAAKKAGLPGIDGLSLLRHFVEHGFAAHVVPTPVFDPEAYLSVNPDLVGLKIWPFEHFIRHGVIEGRPFNKLAMVRIAGPAGAASRSAVRQRLMIATGEIPTRLAPEERARIGGLIESQNRLRTVMASGELAVIMAQAQALDPAVGELDDFNIVMMPPFYNPLAEPHRALRARLPRSQYDSIVCVPWIRTGGSDLLTGQFIQSLRRILPNERVLLLRTDNPHYERPEWIPSEIDVVDVSDILKDAGDTLAEQLLYTMFLGLAPKRVFNINSRLGWRCLRRFGERLAESVRLYGHLFCWDQTKSGRRIGYPSDFFAVTAPYLAGLMTDNQYLVNELTRMYQLPPELAARMMPLNTPTRVKPPSPTMAERSLAHIESRLRPTVLWGGRLDYQKRFDILVEVAARMPDVDFLCWGLAVLDAPPDMATLSRNIRMNGPFKSPTDLPLEACDGWLFTSAWEGMPNILIELATLGVPIVASSVGAVPYLIDAETGWPVDPDAGIDAYVDAVRDMLSNPARRVTKAIAAQARAVAMFSPEAYDRTLAGYLARTPGDIAI